MVACLLLQPTLSLWPSLKKHLIWFLTGIYSAKWVSMIFVSQKKYSRKDRGLRLFSVDLRYTTFILGHQATHFHPGPQLIAKHFRGVPHWILTQFYKLAAIGMITLASEMRKTWLGLKSFPKLQQFIPGLFPDLRFLMTTFSCLQLLTENVCFHHRMAQTQLMDFKQRWQRNSKSCS